MTLRAEGIFTTVVCDTCAAEHETTETLPVLAFYDATLRHGWVGGGDLTPKRTGVHCPECVTATIEETKP